MRGIGAGTRLFELLDRVPVIHPDTGIPLSPQRRGPISFDNISFEYPSRKGVNVLKGFELQLNVGESVAIV
jgi:ABC-type multidrug transport system fused ATPase/permease subunit